MSGTRLAVFGLLLTAAVLLQGCEFNYKTEEDNSKTTHYEPAGNGTYILVDGAGNVLSIMPAGWQPGTNDVVVTP